MGNRLMILRDILKSYLEKEYGDILEKDEISKILRLKYTGWGRLSKAFLTDIYHVDEYTGEHRNILEMLWETNCNLMQLLSFEYDFVKKIDERNKKTAKIQKEYNIPCLMTCMYPQLLNVQSGEHC